MLNQKLFVVTKETEFICVWHFGILGAFQLFHQHIDSTLLYYEVVNVPLSTTPCYDTQELDFFGVRCGHFGILGAFQWFHQNIDSTMLYCVVVNVKLSTTVELDFLGVRCGQGWSRMRILISPRFLRLTSAHPNIPPESQCISEHLHTCHSFDHKCVLSVPLPLLRHLKTVILLHFAALQRGFCHRGCEKSIYHL